MPRGVAVQADLGGVTGGQASLYLRAKAAHEQITRMLDSLQPLRTDADPEDCEAYRGLVRDSVRRIVMELGREGGPRVALVDSAFSDPDGLQPPTTLPAAQAPPGRQSASSRIGCGVRERPPCRPAPLPAAPLAPPGSDPDNVPASWARCGTDSASTTTTSTPSTRRSSGRASGPWSS